MLAMRPSSIKAFGPTHKDGTDFPYTMECAYIVDLASVVGICRCAHNTTEVGNEPLRKRVERLTGH
jgi:hypothetical protein